MRIFQSTVLHFDGRKSLTDRAPMTEYVWLCAWHLWTISFYLHKPNYTDTIIIMPAL